MSGKRGGGSERRAEEVRIVRDRDPGARALPEIGRTHPRVRAFLGEG